MFPGLAIFLTVLAVNFVGDGLRDAFDPRRRGARMSALLEVDGLAVQFAGDGRAVRAVDGVSFSVDAGETVAVVGESGSGKSVTALAVMGLVDPPGRITERRRPVRRPLARRPRRDEYRELRGRDLAMVFQDPLTALNPVMRVGDQIAEAIARAPGRHLRAAAPTCGRSICSSGSGRGSDGRRARATRTSSRAACVNA